jgi:uncharacterized protein (TIGR03437 family)
MRRPFLFTAGLWLILASLAHAAAADISLTPASLSFKYQTGSALPAALTLQIKSTGTPLVFTIVPSGPLPYGAQWLSVTSAAGITPVSLKVYANPTGLPAGNYTATITISAPGAATTSVAVPVTLQVGDPPGTLTASTASLNFSYVTGGAAPSAQPVVLMTSGGALTASIAVSGGSWLKAAPSGSIALVGLPGTVSVTVDPTGLAPGAYTGKVTFASASAANKSIAVNVTLNVTAGAPTIAAGGVWPPGVLVASPATTITITGTNFFVTSTAASGTTQLATTVLSSSAMLVTIPAALLATAGSLPITVTTPTAATPSNTGSFLVYGPGPQVWAVANSASYTISAVSPGGIITVYGVGVGPAALTTFPGTSPLPTSLPATGPATSITIDGQAAPLLYTSANQASCIVPYAVAAKSGSQVDLVVTYDGTASTAFPVNVVDADPGMFSIDSSGTGQGAILNFNPVTGDYTVNGPSNAALKGSTVVLYLTGFGAVTCVDATGSACPAAPDETLLVSGTVTPSASVGVTIGGQAATVLAAVAPVGSVAGLLQVNATLPSTMTAGNAVPVVVSVGAAHSQSRVTMVVK